MRVEIREIVPNDYNELLAIFKEFSEFQNSSDEMVNTIDNMIRDTDYINGFVACEKSGGIIGYVIYFFAYYTWSGKAIYMDDLYVKEAYRGQGQGYGKQLLESVIAFAKDNNCHKVKWQVSNWNTKAMEFYKSIGAKITDIENNCDLIIE